MPGPLVVYDPLYRMHVQNPGHPERPERLDSLLEGVKAANADIVAPSPLGPSEAADLPKLVHSPAYVEAIRHFGEGRYDPDTWVHADTFDIAVRAAAGAVLAADSGIAGRPAFALLRPPGHHAGPDNAAGFCYFNNIAIAAEKLRKDEQARRIAIVDLDVHHGDGTEKIFEARPDVLYISTHQWPLYPGTGAVDHSGAGEGVGFNVNVPLPAGSGDATYAIAFERIIEPVLTEFRPDVVLVSLGFDAHQRDPLASLALSTAGYAACAERLLSFARERCGSRIAFFLEGGYDLEALRDCGEGIANVLAGAPVRSRFPESEDTLGVGKQAVESARAIQKRYWKF